MSYDEHSAHAAYAEGENVSFTLLSDPDSRVIEEYGVLNTEIPAEEAVFHGIPFPGTFLIDESGIVKDKLFARHLAVRDSAETMVDRMLGRVDPGATDPIAHVRQDDGIEVSAFLRGGGGSIRIGPRRRLMVRFSLPPGIHIYDAPVPEGMVAATITVDAPEGIETEMARQPGTKPLVLPGIETPLQVWEGEVDFEITIYANSALTKTVSDLEKPEIEISVDVRYQACDDVQCFIPQTRRLSLIVPVLEIVTPNFGMMKGMGGTTVNMDTAKHFKALSDRQTAKTGSGGASGAN